MLISATQEFETTDLDIVYKVTDADDTNVTTGLLAYIDGDDSFENVIIPKTFIGDVTGKIGENVDVNVTHSLSWDMPMIGTHRWVRWLSRCLPRMTGNCSTCTLWKFPQMRTMPPRLPSTVPLKNEDYLAAFRYLLATGDPEIKLEKGMVLLSDANTTPISPDSLSGLALWLDGNDIDGNGQPDSLNDGDLISFWKDKSGK